MPPKATHYLTFQSVDYDNTRWRLFQRRAVCTKLDIYVFDEDKKKFS